MTEPSNKPGTKTVVKTSGKEFKNLIKDCLKELIQEGVLDNRLTVLVNQAVSQRHQSQPIEIVDPQVQLAAQIGATVGKGNKVYENIFADTMMNTVPVQNAADPQRYSSMYGQPQQINPYIQQPQYAPQVNPYVQSQPQQQYLNSGNPYIQEGGQQLPAQPQQNTGGYPTLWAKYAFSKPLSNRPSGTSVLSGLMGG